MVHGQKAKIVFIRDTRKKEWLALLSTDRDFDGLVAHTAISMLRYVFIAFEKRIHDDPRTFGELFLAYCDEITDLSLWDALKKMLALLEDLIHHSHRCSNCIIDGFIKEILSAFDRFFIESRPLAT